MSKGVEVGVQPVTKGLEGTICERVGLGASKQSVAMIQTRI